MVNVYDEDGHSVIQCNIRDITARKRAEAAKHRLDVLTASNEKLEQASVAALPPNIDGLCGLPGNVSEWVDTDFEPIPAPKPTDKPTDKPKVLMGTLRGGNWRSGTQDELQASMRLPVPPDTRRNTIGFRIVLKRGK